MSLLRYAWQWVRVRVVAYRLQRAVTQLDPSARVLVRGLSIRAQTTSQRLCRIWNEAAEEAGF